MGTLAIILFLTGVLTESQNEVDNVDVSSSEFIDFSPLVTKNNKYTIMNCVIIMNLMISFIQYTSLISKRMKMQYDNMIEVF